MRKDILRQNKKGKRIRIGIGETITVEEQLTHPEVKDFNLWLRDKVYGMPLPQSFESYLDYSSRTRD